MKISVLQVNMPIIGISAGHYLTWTLIGAVRDNSGVAGTLLPSTLDALLGSEWLGLNEHAHIPML